MKNEKEIWVNVFNTIHRECQQDLIANECARFADDAIESLREILAQEKESLYNVDFYQISAPWLEFFSDRLSKTASIQSSIGFAKHATLALIQRYFR